MAASLRTELREFVDHCKGIVHPDEPLNVQVHHCVQEAGDILGLVLNAGSNVDELSNELVGAVGEVIDLLKLGPVAKRIAKSSLPLIVPAAVEFAAQYTGTAQEFVNRYVTPHLRLWAETLDDLADDLSGEA